MTTYTSIISSKDKRDLKFKRDQVVLVVPFLSLVLSLVSFVISWQKRPLVFSVVDIQQLIHAQSKNLAAQSSSKIIDLKRLQQTADSLKSSLETWAQDHHTLLFAKGTVWGGASEEGLPDVTVQIMTDLNGTK